MFLRIGLVIICFLAEIGLGVYTYFHFESLMTRFLFFVFTAICIAFLVIQTAGRDSSQKEKENLSQLATKGKNNPKDLDLKEPPN